MRVRSVVATAMWSSCRPESALRRIKDLSKSPTDTRFFGLRPQNEISTNRPLEDVPRRGRVAVVAIRAVHIASHDNHVGGIEQQPGAQDRGHGPVESDGGLAEVIAA